jgi:hypothetical protein
MRAPKLVLLALGSLNDARNSAEDLASANRHKQSAAGWSRFVVLHDGSHTKILLLDPFPARENSVTPRLLPLSMFHELEPGATTNEVAIAVGVRMEWV